MPLDLSALNVEDQQAFLARLSKLGLDASVGQQDLVVPRSSTITLAYGQKSDTFIKPIVRNISDFGTLKQIIGIDDRVFQKGPSTVPLPKPIQITSAIGTQRFDASPGMVKALQPSSIDSALLGVQHFSDIRLAARAYLLGNSALVASYKPLIEAHFSEVNLPIWVIVNVTIAAGATLIFGPGVNVLTAYKIEIEEGGTILSYGHLSVDCVALSKTVPLFNPVHLQISRFQ